METSKARLARIIRGFPRRTIGVLGDYMLDEFLRGDATRISPEAPVPVVKMGSRHEGELYAGGAGNVAVNIAALGGRAIPFGVIGNDETGDQLGALLRTRRIPTASLLRERGRVTPRKIRIVAHQHQMLRLDFESPARIAPRTEAALLRVFTRWMGRLDALVISDYQKGTATTELCHQISAIARQKRVPVFVDPKPEHPEICRNATVVTPNLREAELMAGIKMQSRQALGTGGQRLLADFDCSYLLVTRGSEGMTLFEPNSEPHEIHSLPRPVYDVTGAGDTVIAALALAFSSGATMKEAAELANLAGSRVVLKFGTAEITGRELLDAVAGNFQKS